MNDENELCIVCDKPAVWVRYTQFSGAHPFCQEHAAEAESDFGEKSHNEIWDRIVKEP